MQLKITDKPTIKIRVLFDKLIMASAAVSHKGAWPAYNSIKL